MKKDTIIVIIHMIKYTTGPTSRPFRRSFSWGSAFSPFLSSRDCSDISIYLYIYIYMFVYIMIVL